MRDRGFAHARGTSNPGTTSFAALSSRAQIAAGVVAIGTGSIKRRHVQRVFADDTAPLDECLRSGLLVADGAALRFCDERFRVAIRDSLSRSLEREISRCLVAALVCSDDGVSRPITTLTAREREVTVLLCDGLRNAEIATRLRRSVRTIDHHIEAILSKMGAATRTEAVATALRAGIGSR